MFKKLFINYVLLLLLSVVSFRSLSQQPTATITGSNIGNCMPDTLTLTCTNTTPYIIGWGLAGSTIYAQRDTAIWNHHATTVAGDPMNAPQPAPTNTSTPLNLLFNPRAVFVDNQQRVFVAERGGTAFNRANHRVVRWDPPYTTGVRVAGSIGNPPVATYSANAGPATDSNLSSTTGVWVDANYIYVLEPMNMRVMRYPNNAGSTSGPAPTGIVIAGNGANGSTPVANPLSSNLADIFFDVAGNMYVLDAGNHCVQKFSVIGGFGSGIFNPQGTVVAGIYGAAGTSLSQLSNPSGMYIDGGSNFIYIADYANQRVMKFPISPIGSGTVVAGITGSLGSSSNKLNGPTDVWADCNGYLYVADGGGSNARIQRFNPNSVIGDDAITIAGFGPNIVTSNTTNSDSQLHQPIAFFMNESHVNGVTNNGVFYVVDQGNCHRVQRYNLNTINTKFVPTGVITKKVYTATILQSFGCNATGLISNKDTVYAVPTGITATATNPTTCGGSNGKITITGVTNGITYNYSYTVNGVTIDSLNKVAGSITANSLVINNLQAGVYSNIVVYFDPNKHCTSIPLQITLSGPVYPSAPTLASNVISVCSGNPISFTVTAPTGAGYTYLYSGPGITGVQSSGIGNIQTTTGATLAYSGVDTIRAQYNGCISLPTLANVTVIQSLTISATSVPPTGCTGGCNGSITINGLQSGTTYAVSSSSTGTTLPTSVSTGANTSVTFANLCTGVYSNIKLTPQGSTCSSNAININLGTTGTTFTLTQTGPTSCGASNGVITISGLLPSTNGYSYSLNSVTTNNVSTNASGQIIINSSLPAGTYTITVTYGGCTSPSQQITLSDPIPPSFTLSQTAPTTCGGTNGTITISGLNPTTGYSYILNSLSPVSATTDTSGQIIINNNALSTGVDTVKVISAGCISTPSTVTIPQGAVPNISITTVNPTTCTSLNGTVTISGLTPNASGYSYTINSTTVNNITASATGTYTINNLGIGTYLVNISLSGCTSNIDTAILIVPGVPTFTLTKTDPTTCNGTNGSITINGLGINTPGYSYTLNGTIVNNVTSTATGTITISNLPAGTDSVKVSLSGCTSAFQYITLVNPGISSFSLSQQSNTCGTTNGSITITGLNPNTGYSYFLNTAGPFNFTSSVSGTDTIYNLGAGTYTVQIGSGSCASPAQSITITTLAPGTVTLTKIDPTTCSLPCNGSITLNGLSAGVTYNVTCSNAALNTNNITPTGTSYTFYNLCSGTYNNILLTPQGAGTGCALNTVNTTLNQPSAPAFSLTSTPPTACGNSNGTISINGLNTNTGGYSYTLNGVTTSNLTSSSSGSIIIYNLPAGTDTITVSKGGCISTSQYITLSATGTPTFSLSKINPECATNNGSITISNLTPNNANYFYYMNSAGPVSFTSNSSGEYTISGLSPGVDTIKIKLGNCVSAIQTITINNPAILPPVAGSIFGQNVLCVGNNNFYIENINGGTWSTASGNASITSAGVATGVTEGPDVILYTVTNLCGSATAVKGINVYSIPVMDTITGPDSVCIGNTISMSLSNSSATGTWSSVTGNAFVSSTGMVYGVSAGIDTVKFNITNACGNAMSRKTITVINCTSGINTVANQELSVYPNPAHNIISISATMLIHKIDIYNLVGQSMLSENYHSNYVSVDITELPAGLYLLKVNDTKFFKIVKE